MTEHPPGSPSVPLNPSDASNPAAATVREILEEARRVAGSGTRLATRLEELGVGPPDSSRYSESAVSNWIRGRTMPPADVLVAAAQIAGMPVGASASAPEAGKVQALEDGAESLQHQVDSLRTAVIDLYGRLGYPMPKVDAPQPSPASNPRRSAAG